LKDLRLFVKCKPIGARAIKVADHLALKDADDY